MAEEEIKQERKIIVAVDEGEESSYALTWCLNNIIHQNYKDTLFLLYAKTSRDFYPSVDGTGYMFSSDVLTSMEKYNKEIADSVMGKAKSLCNNFNNVVVETIIEKGDARDVICEMAEKLHVDLVVLGSHGYGVFKRAFLGSVSNHCAQNLKCAVLIVKIPKTDADNKTDHKTKHIA